MANRSKRNPLRTNPNTAGFALHPTKGYRRVAIRRVVAQGRIPHMVSIWSRLGAAVR